MKTLRRFFILLFFTFVGLSSAQDYGNVQFEKGYYYVVIKNAKFDAVNSILQGEIKSHKWGVIHTINVDKSTNSPVPHKTYLLCRSDYLERGIRFNKNVISVVIPCRISIYQDGNNVKILVEDVEGYNNMFGIEDTMFKSFLAQVSEEMKSILQKTADRFHKKQNFPNM